MSDDASTETNLAVAPAAAADTAPYLFVVTEAARPLAGSARLCCGELDTIAIGRDEHRGCTIADRDATLAIPNRQMSSVHARICRVAGGWELVDAGSKNGTRVDGAPVSRVALRDGAWIDLGKTLLRFRLALPAAERWVDAETAAPTLGIVSVVPGFAAQLATLARLAASRVSLVIAGATGTGKELVARGVHVASARPGPFVAVNCAALTDGLAESQLFGHRRGAFSGAIADHPGLVRAADRGTLLLDEVGDLPLQAQALLLRVLQEREVLAVGETRPVAVDVRVIAATHRDLASLVATGEFRADLYARLAGHVEVLPPLAARREDLGTIIASALHRHAGGVTPRLTIEAAHRLATATWPLNVRELDKAIEAALALAGDGVIDVAHLPTEPAPGGDAALRARLASLLAEHRGNVTQIAKAMGKARMQVQRWLRRFELDPERYR